MFLNEMLQLTEINISLSTKITKTKNSNKLK